METTLETEEFQLTEDQKQYFDYPTIEPRLKELISSWSAERTATTNRRNERYIDVDVADLRKKGALKPDETFIPVRVIDTNITREESDYTSFLKTSRRLIIFDYLADQSLDTSALELAVTKGLRYEGWFEDFYQTRDGAAVHGWDAIEVVFDETKPLHVGFEHIGHDELYWNRHQNLQDSELVVRRYLVTGTRLEEFVAEFGFNSAAVDEILKKNQESVRRFQSTYTIYKGYFKYGGVVFVYWFTDEYGVKDWLKSPEPLRLGISQQFAPDPASIYLQGGIQETPAQGAWVDVDLDIYPIFVLPYKLTEERNITSGVGRCFLDGDWQEAQTSTVTGFVNSLNRATNVYASPKNQGEDSSMKQLDIVLENGKIFSQPLDFFSTPIPDSVVLSALNYLGTYNSQQAGQVNYAAMNRKDSRKTATEMAAATEESNQQKATPMALFSEWLRKVFSFSWRIIQSQALQNKISLLADPMTGMNNQALLELDYLILPAGDVDFIERKDKELKMMQHWPVVAQTALAPRFLADFLRLAYPDVGEQYAQILMTQPSGSQLIQALSAMLQTLISPEEVNSLPPEQQQTLMMLQQQVQQYLGQNESSRAIQQGNSPQQY